MASPYGSRNCPVGPTEASEGRFLVIDPGSRDPVVLLNRRVTVVGEVLGTRERTVDEAAYRFPLLSARFIHIWAGAPGYGLDEVYPAYPSYYAPYTYGYYPARPGVSVGFYFRW